MQKQGTTRSATRPRAPWSLTAVTVIALLLPPGGALLAVRNLARVHRLDGKRATELTVTVFALYSLGLTILLLLASPNGGRPAQISSGVSTVLSFGTAIACYMALRRPYLEWRIANPSARSSSWLTAVGTSLVYTFAISFAVAVVRLLIALVAYVFNWNVGQL